MHAKSLSTALVVTALSSALAASAAHAACGNRPGTPNEVKAETLANSPHTAIRFSWRNTTGKGMNKSGSTSQGDTPHSMYFDISVRDGRGNQVFKDMTGTGPFKVTYGSRSHQDFTGLSTNGTFCFKIRARTAGGTKGCVSQIFSAQVCATTAASAPPKRRTGKVFRSTGGKPPAPAISVKREDGNVFLIQGDKFRPNAPVTIRAVDAFLRTEIYILVGIRRITSDANGRLGIRLIGICKGRGTLDFSANDARPNPSDKTGTLWSNTVRSVCQ